MYIVVYEFIFPPTTSPTLVKNINIARFTSENMYTEFLINIDLNILVYCLLSFYVVNLLKPLPIFPLKCLNFLMTHKNF